ncbi:MAG: MoxR family ATPase [Oscillospiraceae bacterium]|nr:MoxR family ATPase [Oscillospiraceae bacterium]
METTSSNSQAALNVMKNVAHAIVGKDTVILRVFLAILARGHILIEDIPGVGKTTLAVAFSKALALKYSRIQFTPDILPSDVTGFSIYDKDTGRMSYMPGAVMCNLFLADELNRATSRTQSALLEAMEEGQVTVDGVTYEIPQPFIVIATQNPVGAAGTQLLPDSQVDRFMVRLSLGYPSPNDELSLLKRKQGSTLLDLVETVLTGAEIERMREDVDKVYVDPAILNYIVALVSETRRHRDLTLGASPRASLALTAISRAMAYVQGRDYVTPKDITPLISDTLAHRLILKPGYDSEGITTKKVLDSIVRSVREPKIG